jgi:hypothetical protein
MAPPGEGSAGEPIDDTLDRLAVLVDGVVAQECAHHYHAHTQEHQFSSRLAQAIESELRHFSMPGLDIEVITRDFPDRGRGSMEKRSGADLYISLVRRDAERPVSKGMLVQSKWDYALRHTSERRRLRDQSRDMLARTEDAYVWVYEDTGVAVVPATVAASSIRPIPLPWPRRTVGELVADGLRCTAGDRAIGRNLDQPIVPSLNTMLERLSAETAMEFVVETGG